ncbi:unnamed protein product [Paramecium pentaurelia]|uniref:Palmitoyltransferase n=1 Tax=Paramecium pentaurelia TaxID=43138 RepID=A0A8S1SL13_9CILI|nr:unnamed protein product [Paramecium pentaurelia]
MSLDSSQKCDEETGLKSIAPEPLELDETYQTPVDIRWGNCYPLVIKNNIPKIVIGPHWPLFIFAYSLFIAASIFLIGWHFTSTSSEFIKWATFIVCVNQCWSYAWVALINPGVINYDKNNSMDNRPRCSQQLNIENDSKTWYCSVCKLLQLHGTVHCRDCDLCIQEMDHHCPWTGKCIGKGNIKQFYYFLVSTLIFMIFNIIGSLTQLDGSLNGTRRKVKQGN